MTTLRVPAPEGAEPRRRFAPDLGGVSMLPLWVLFSLSLVDEFDRIAFAAMTPEIRDSFGLSDSGIVAIGAISSVFILVGALPLGFLGDRMPRVRLAGIAGAVWAAMAVVTGLAWVVPVLFLARLCAGVARTSNEVVHPSLLVDFYPPEQQPKAFQIHRLSNPLSALGGLAIGGIGAVVGWRMTFVLLASPAVVILILLSRLREPRRGGNHLPEIEVDPTVGDAEPLSFGEARRVLFGVRTLRRCWIGGFLLGVAFIANAQLLSLFFEHVHRFGPLGRGVVQFANGAGLVVGIVIGARASARATAAGAYGQLTRVVAASFMIGAVSLALMAALPWAAGAVAAVFVLGIGLGVYQPAFYPLVARIVPANVRTQAFGWTLVFAGMGALFAIPLAKYGQNESYRAAFVVLAVIITVGALVVASSRGAVAGDIKRAEAASA